MALPLAELHEVPSSSWSTATAAKALSQRAKQTTDGNKHPKTLLGRGSNVFLGML